VNATRTDKGGAARWQNPYVGPRAFRRGEQLPAREQEIYELTDLLIAERVVLLHAPSGAGKTSLVQAGVVPMLERDSMLPGKPFRPSKPLRVKTPPPSGRSVRNRYIYSVALDLLPDRDPLELESLTLPEVVEAATQPSAEHIPVLVFDQFEEILLLDPTDWDHQEMFFRELGEALADGYIWALFAMREDYMGGLDRYLHQVPGHLRATYRLDFLDTDAARIAIQQPAADHGVTVADDAADELLRRLRTVRVQSPSDGVEEVQAPYVQPFQLQVVCRNLWKVLTKEKRNRFRKIDLGDVERHADIGGALRGYYADAIADVGARTGAEELAIRDWFEHELITVQGLRNQTVTGPRSGDVDPRTVALALEDAYLVRSDTRAGTVWYELAHDQLITPILQDNRAWRYSRLESWQLTARDWQATHQRELLLVGPELRYAQRRAETVGASPAEREFLAESSHAEQDRSVLERMRYTIGLLGLVALLELVAIVVLLALLLLRG